MIIAFILAGLATADASTVKDIGGSGKVVSTSIGDFRETTLVRMCEADIIIIGTVLSSKPKDSKIVLNDGNTIPIVASNLIIAVERVAKGDPPAKLNITVKGGTRGAITAYNTNNVWPKHGGVGRRYMLAYTPSAAGPIPWATVNVEPSVGLPSNQTLASWYDSLEASHCGGGK